MTTTAHRHPLRSGGYAWGPSRVKAGVSIRQLAAACGINSGDLSKMENGRMIPRADEWERVMSALRDAEAGTLSVGSTATS